VSNEITGNVYLIDEEKTYGQKGFRKRQIVIQTEDGAYEQYIPVEFIQDGCDRIYLNELKVGDNVKVGYRLTGRRWQPSLKDDARYFLGCEVTSLEILVPHPGTGETGRQTVEDHIPF